MVTAFTFLKNIFKNISNPFLNNYTSYFRNFSIIIHYSD
nr:MAG TPA: hypothetical protein [Caudoviricetes sp.]